MTRHLDEDATRVQPAAVTATVLAISSLTVMANATIAPALPDLAEHFADVPGIETLAGLVLSLPSIAIVLTAGLFGLLTERVDRLRLLLAAMVLYALGGASALLVDSLGAVLAGRVALGVGVAGTMTIATLLAGTLWTGEARERFMGWQSAAMSAGGIVFLLAGGWLAEVSWRAPFGLYLAALPLAIWAAFSLRGAAGGVRRREVDDAPFDGSLFLRIGGIGCVAMLAFYLIPTRLPFLLRELGYSLPSVAGIAIAAVTVASVPAALLYARLRRRHAATTLFAGSFLLMGLGLATIGLAGSFTTVLPGGLLVGLGLGSLMPNLGATLMERLSPSSRGRAAGLLTMAVFSGQFLSPLLSGAAMSLTGISLGTLFVVCGIVLTLAAIGIATGRARLPPAAS